ncbi:MAG TPA: hypothetical protein VMU72_05900 [Gaiellaceae bacterium]|nr:hypothetical protein [Gaiellaceae bacterium]
MAKRDSIRHGLVVAAVVAGLAVLVAGCGGGSSPSSAGQTQQTTTQQTTTQQTTTGSSGTNFASAKNCLQFAGLAAKIAGAMNPSSGNAATALQTESQELQALANAAPSAIKGDFQTFATAFSSYLQALQSSGYNIGSKTPPTAAQLSALANAAKVFNTTKLKQAEQHLSTWAAQNCK